MKYQTMVDRERLLSELIRKLRDGPDSAQIDLGRDMATACLEAMHPRDLADICEVIQRSLRSGIAFFEAYHKSTGEQP